MNMIYRGKVFYHECRVESFVEFFIFPAGLRTMKFIAVDAIVAAQHHRSPQARQFLLCGDERTLLVSHAISEFLY